MKRSIIAIPTRSTDTPIVVAYSNDNASALASVWAAAQEKTVDRKGRPVSKYDTFINIDAAGNTQNINPSVVRPLDQKPVPPDAVTLNGLLNSLLELDSTIAATLSAPHEIRQQLSEVESQIHNLRTCEGCAIKAGQKTAALEASAGILRTRLATAEAKLTPPSQGASKIHELTTGQAGLLQQLNRASCAAGAAFEEALHKQRAAALLPVLNWIPGLTLESAALRSITGRLFAWDPPAVWGRDWSSSQCGNQSEPRAAVVIHTRQALAALAAAGEGEDPYSSPAALAEWQRVTEQDFSSEAQPEPQSLPEAA